MRYAPKIAKHHETIFAVITVVLACIVGLLIWVVTATHKRQPIVTQPKAVVSAKVMPTADNPCAAADATIQPPKTYKHIVWIWMENKSYDKVFGNGASGNDYEKALLSKCGSTTQFLDNMFGDIDMPSRTHYLAAVSGSNCNAGLTGNAAPTSGCQVNNEDAKPSNQLDTVSLFEQLTAAGKTWRSYQESSPQNCSYNSGSDGTGKYATKHDPVPYFSRLKSSCASNDVAFSGITCTASGCAQPTENALLNDIKKGTLPTFSSITPNLCNDTHDCDVATGDQWLRTYVTKILDGPNYKAGDTAVMILWDESTPGQPQPNIFISPTTPLMQGPTVVNLFSVLRATQAMLGLSPYLGCASGMVPDSNNQCPTGSTADLRLLFSM